VRDIAWHAIERHELATLLSEAKRLSSRAVGSTTIYELEHNGQEIVAMALPDGHALIVERAPKAKWRRRIDPTRSTTPASR
jgi:hypothetical protein